MTDISQFKALLDVPELPDSTLDDQTARRLMSLHMKTLLMRAQARAAGLPLPPTSEVVLGIWTDLFTKLSKKDC